MKVTQNRVVKEISEQKQCSYLPSIIQKIALQGSLVENHSQTSVPTDIPVNIALTEKPDKK